MARPGVSGCSSWSGSLKPRIVSPGEKIICNGFASGEEILCKGNDLICIS